jgi:hypothetical protein
MSLASAVGAGLVQVLAGVGVGLMALKYLYRGYQAVYVRDSSNVKAN